jgi:hypothetical protein
MSRTVVIHQPDFLPWLGFFDRLLAADLFVVLDHVQFVSGTSRSWIHRDKIKTPQGERWLSLHVQKAPLGTPIKDILLKPDVGWRTENLNQLRENYRKAPYFNEIFPLVEQVYLVEHNRMVTLNVAGLDLLETLLDVRTPRLYSSEMSPQGTSTSMLVDLLRKAGATRYVSGLGAKNYLDIDALDAAGIELVWQDFKHPVYPQLYGEFVPMLSSIDLLFNCGIKGAQKFLRGKPA